MSNEFEEFITSFLRAYAYYNPTEVFRSGWREFAGVLPIYSEGRIKAYIQFLQTNLKRLLNIPIHSLTEVEQLNHLVLQKEIKSQLFDYNDTKEYLTNPLFYTSFYNGPMIVFDYLLKNYAPLEQRVLELSSFLIQIPEYYENALKNLQIEKLAPEHLEITTLMLEGLTSFLANIVQEIQSLENLEQKVCAESYQILQNASIIASNGIKSYLINIRAQLPNAKGSFRMGKELFLKMLVNKECISLSIEDLLNLGEKDLEKNFTEFKSVLNKINPNESPEEIIAEIKKDHPSKDSLLSDTQNMLQKLKIFIAEKEFVSIPSDVMPKVIFTPKPLQPYAFANMDSPGALEQNVTNCYYYITPPDDSWGLQEQEEWLQRFNYRALLDISAHEVFPGHYLQHLHNQQNLSLISKLFGSYHFWEGYAHYIEEAIWQTGFQQEDYKYRVVQLLEALIRNVRFIVAIKLHTTTTFTVEDGTQLFMKYAFMDRKPAESEAKRGTYDPRYFNYCLGKLMIKKLLEDYKREKGNTFTLKEFHNKLLSYGAPPIPILRKFILKNPDIFEKIF